MSWDPLLLRKYNTTGHFRLLNQLRGELKANPLKRPGSEGEESAQSRAASAGRAIEVRPQAQGYNRGRRFGGYGAPATAGDTTLPNSESLAAAAASSFRERLNAIEMR